MGIYAVLRELGPSAGTDRLKALDAALGRNFHADQITASDETLAMFLAQTAHESARYTRLEENLNYSAAALRRTWPSRFPEGVAERYERRPIAIANRAYANRMGNGPEPSGDGWTFRGRGLIQITGRNNYTRLAAHWGMELSAAVERCGTPDGAMDSAIWYWNVNGIAALGGDLERVTRVINGGLNGIEDRRALYDKALDLVTSVGRS